MKVLLTTLNSKYVQSNLALRYLRSYCQKLPIRFLLREFNINQQLDYIMAEIYKAKADVIAFSCYIWNITPILQLCDSLKKISPETIIVLGGPEVSFDSVSILAQHSFIDYIVRGEGEETFYELLSFLIKGEEFHEMAGLIYRKGASIVKGPDRPLIKELDTIPSPFMDNLNEFTNRLVYYESSRGCPFDCQYCLSSTFNGVRTFSMERIKDDLMRLINAKVPKVKFVDRTFNFKANHALEIMEFIVQNQKKTTFHFEMTPHLITEDLLDFLNNVPAGLFQFEIGVQSTYEPALKKIHRVNDYQHLTKVVKLLKGYKNIHLHLDLIAGLPEEDYVHFQKSFNDVFCLRPDNLQLGFLKLLKGSGIRKNAAEYDYRYLTEPPYEILSNNIMSYEEILELKMVEDLLETYYNSHRFEMTIDFIITRFYYQNPYQFFKEIKEEWEERGYNHAPVKDVVLYLFLLEFFERRVCREKVWIVNEYIKYDFLQNYRTINPPEWLNSIEVEDYRNRCYQFVRNSKKVQSYIPHLSHLEGRQILRKILIEPFSFDVFKHSRENYKEDPQLEEIFILFDYDTRHPISGHANTMKVEI